MYLNYPETLKCIDPKTLEESEIKLCRFDNKTIFSKDLNAKVKYGCIVIRTYSDGFIEQHKVLCVDKKLGTLVIQI